jgi:CubicO group peptidase (beta-lactamase class C family)
MRRTVLPPLVLAALLLASPIFRDATHAQGSSQVWPTKEWQTSPPEDQGMDSAALAQLVDMGAYTGLDSMLIARHGKIVAEAYYAPFRSGIKHRMYSVTKSVLGALIAIAVKDGILDSVDHRVIDFFRKHQIANIDDYNTSITVQNLLDMTSGLDWTRLIPLTQVACPVFSGFHAGLRSPQPVEDVVGGPYETVRFIDRQRGSYRPLDPG